MYNSIPCCFWVRRNFRWWILCSIVQKTLFNLTSCDRIVFEHHYILSSILQNILFNMVCFPSTIFKVTLRESFFRNSPRSMFSCFWNSRKTSEIVTLGQAGSTIILATQLSFVIFVLRKEFAFMFKTFSRNDPPGKAPPSRGCSVFKKRKRRREKEKK